MATPARPPVGVAFTRNPANGVNEFYGEFSSTPGRRRGRWRADSEPVLKLEQMPESYAELMAVRKTLEKHFKDVQDVEFYDSGRQVVHAPDAERQAHGDGRAEVLDGHGQREASSTGRLRFCGTRRISSISCLRPCSISPRSRRPPIATGLPAGRAQRPARFISTQTVRSRLPSAVKRCCSLRMKPRPKICAA